LRSGGEGTGRGKETDFERIWMGGGLTGGAGGMGVLAMRWAMKSGAGDAMGDGSEMTGAASVLETRFIGISY
jgi:hypothetical protein